MALERGGLRYPIIVEDRFSEPLLRFRDDLARARESWNAFRADIAALKPDASGIRQMVREVRNASAATREQAAASGKSTKAFNVQKAALKALQAELQRNRVEAEKNRLAEQQGLQTKSLARQESQRRTQFLKQETAAQKQLTAQINAAAKAEQEAQRVKEKALAAGIKAGEAADAVARRSVANTQVRLEKERQAAINAEIARGKRDAIAILDKFDQDQAKSSDASARTIKVNADAIAEYQKRLRAAHVQEDALNSTTAQGDLSAARRIQANANAITQYQQRLVNAHKAEQAAAQRAKNAVDAQNRSLDRAEVFGNRLIFTFRRLIGAFAVFQAARVVVGGFRDMLAAGIEFNQSLEQSRIGIAGIITSVANVTDEQGRLLTGAEKYAAAQKVAADQQEKLRQDALSTTATYKELVDAFQQGLAPGLNAGIKDLDTIRKLVVGVSQAMTAIGQPQNQFSEEFRAIATGRIKPGQSRVAQAIGLTPDLVRESQRLGTFTQLALDKLNGFNLAAQDSAKTVGGLFLRLKDVMQLVTGRASRGLFQDLKSTFQGVFDSLTSREKTAIGDVLKPDPQVQQAFESLYQAVQKVLTAIRTSAAEIGKGGFIEFAHAIATGIEAIGVGLVNMIAGIVRGVGYLYTVLSALTSPIRAFADEMRAAFGIDIFNTSTKWLFTILTGFTGLRIIIATINGAFGFMLNSLSGIAQLVTGINVKAALTKALTTDTGKSFLSGGKRLAAWTGIAFAVVGGFQAIFSSITGIDLELRDLPTAVGIAFESFFTKLGAGFDLLGTRINNVALKIKHIWLDTLTFDFIQQFFKSNDLKKLEEAEQKVLGLSQKALNDRDRRLVEAASDADVKAAFAKRDKVVADADKKAGERLLALQKEVEDRRNLLLAAAGTQGPKTPNIPQQFDVTGQGKAPTEAEKNELATLQAKNVTLRAQVAVKGEIARLTLAGASQAEVDLAAGRAQLEVMRAQSAEKALQLQQEIAVVEAEAQNETNADRKKLLTQKVAALKSEQALSEAQSTAELAAQEEILRRQALLISGTLGQGFQQGLVDFGQQFSSSFAAGIEIAKGLLNGFVQLVSSSIVDAFDPTQKFDLKERFARFLQDIAKLIIQQLTQIAIAKAILGLGLGVPGLADGGPVVGRAQGGSIPRRRASPSLAHFRRPRGLAAGGRPAGLDPTDTVPIWAAPGEWMMRVAAVRKYGVDVMARINSGLVDPIALKSLAVAGGRAPRLRSGHSIGFAEGGQISAPPSAPAASATVVPALIASEETMDTLIRGGERSLIDFMRRNADAISSGRRGRN